MSEGQQQDNQPQRAATRAPVTKPVRLQFDDSLDIQDATCENISIGGMFVVAPAGARPPGTLVRFELLLNDVQTVRGLGEVIWSKPGTVEGDDAGMGVKFRFLEQRDRQLIFKLVSQHIKARLANQGNERPAAPVPPAPVPPAPSPPAPSPPAVTAPRPEPLSAAEPTAPKPSPPVPSPSPAASTTTPRPEPPPAAEPTASKPSPPVPPPLPAASTTPRPEPLPAAEPTAPKPSPPVPSPLPAASTTPRPEPSPAAEPTTPTSSVAEPPPAPAPPPRRPEPATMADLFAPDIDEGASAMSARDEDRAREAPWAGVALPDAGAEPDEDDAGERPTTGLFGTTPAAVDSLRLDAADDDLDLALRDDDSSDVAAPPAARVRHERKVMILPVLLLVLILGAASAYLLRDRLFSGLLQEPDQTTPEAPATGLERDSTAEAPAPSPPPIETSPSPAEPAPVTAAPVPVPPPPSVEPRPPPPVVTAPPVVAAPPPPAARPDPPPEPAPGTGFSRLVDISWRPTASGILVVLAADGAIPRGSIRQFRLGGDSPREVIVLSGVRAGYGKTRMAVGDERLTAIRTGYHPGRGDGELHVVLDLATADVRVAAARNLGRSLEIEITSP